MNNVQLNLPEFTKKLSQFLCKLIIPEQFDIPVKLLKDYDGYSDFIVDSLPYRMLICNDGAAVLLLEDDKGVWNHVAGYYYDNSFHIRKGFEEIREEIEYAYHKINQMVEAMELPKQTPIEVAEPLLTDTQVYIINRYKKK